MRTWALLLLAVSLAACGGGAQAPPGGVDRQLAPPRAPVLQGTYRIAGEVDLLHVNLPSDLDPQDPLLDSRCWILVAPSGVALACP